MTTDLPSRRLFSDGRSIWYIDNIWLAATDLPVEDMNLDEVRELDEVCWFSDLWGKRPTCRAVFEHCRRVNDADMSFPIILGPTGDLLDGMHRIGNALLAGEKRIRAVRLPAMPPADEQIRPDDPRYEAPTPDEEA